jgi:hypothetical protein
VPTVVGKLGEGNPEIARRLIQCLEDKTDAGFRRAVILGLGCVGPAAKEAVPALIEALDDRSESPKGARTYRLASYTLGKIGPPAQKAVPKMLQLVGDRTMPIMDRDGIVEDISRIDRVAGDTAKQMLIKERFP